MEHNRLKKWEIALLLALCISLGWGLIFGETDCYAWWGVIYPDLAQGAGESAATFAAGSNAAGGPVLRSQLWDWLQTHVLPLFLR